MYWIKSYAAMVILNKADHRLFLAAYTVMKFGWPNYEDMPEDAAERIATWLHYSEE